MSEARDRDESGAAVADFVLVSLILIPLFLGIIQVSLVLYVRNTLASAAAEGARAAAVFDGNEAKGWETARRQIGIASGYAWRTTPRWTAAPDAVPPTVTLTLTTRVPALGLFGPAVPLKVSGTAIIELADQRS